MKKTAYKLANPAINLTKPALQGKLRGVFLKMSPSVSETEKQVLEIGDVGIEGEIYAGKIDWEAFLGRDRQPLSAEEQAFLDGPVEELCKLLDDREIYDSKEQDIPKEAWDFIKENKFLGLEIPKEYGGLGFSAYAHSQIIQKISSRSFSGAINVMVPNSLGPALLILNYGTDKQKKELLPKLASGELIPCFALTEDEAGSDATNVQSTGEVRIGEDGKPYIHVTHLSKRYSTLAPIADLPGLALDIKDPDNLLPEGAKTGLTVVLVDKKTPGLEKGNRHKPAGVPFQNGTIRCAEEGMKLSIEENVVGGYEGLGKGWPMLVTQLSIGRGISLPAVSTAGMKLATRLASSYSNVRKQFGLPISQFEGIKGPIGEMAGLTYISDAARRSTLATIDNGQIPSVVTAIVKYHLTENMRKCVIDAADILGGKAVMQGPSNPLFRSYQALPIAITVEGANIMTRNFMIFGQGSVRAHPTILDEIAASENEDIKEGASELWELLINKHIPNLLENAAKAKSLGKIKPTNSFEGYKEQIERLSAAFNVAANLSVITIADKLKSKELLSARMGDVMSYLYMATCAMEKFVEDGSLEEDRPLMEWSVEWSLEKAAEALAEFIPNYLEYYKEYDEKMKERGKRINPVVRMLNTMIPISDTLPKGRLLSKPLDRKTLAAADVVMKPGEARERLLSETFVPKDDLNEPVGLFEQAFEKDLIAQAITKKIKSAIKEGTLESFDLDEAVKQGVISLEDLEAVMVAKELEKDVVAVDEFEPSHFK